MAFAIVHSAEEGRDDNKYPKEKGCEKLKTNLVVATVVITLLSFSSVGQVFATGDFSVTSNCEEISPGTCGSAIITVASINGFSGTVSLTAIATPSTGITPHLSPTSVSVPSGGNANSTLTVSTTCGQSRCEWNVNVTGTSGALSHSVQVFVCRGTNCPI